MVFAKRLSTVLSLLAATLVVTWCTFAARELLTQRETECLVANIVYEAGTEPDRGKRFVAWVTLARTYSPLKFRTTICGVVFQRRQFSWTSEKGKTVASGVSRASERDVEIAREFIALKFDREKLQNAAREFGIPIDAFFYKRHDWNENDPNEKRMSERNKWYWKTCMRPVADTERKPLRIGSHVPYRQVVDPCPQWTGPSNKNEKTGAPS